MNTKKYKIGFALGGGAARGWAHFGIIRALEEQGIKPDIICGTSMGALVGAAYVTHCHARFEEWVISLRKRDIAGLLDITVNGGGLIEGGRVMNFLREQLVENVKIEDLDLPYAAVATELTTGNEVWFQQGDLLDAVRASVSLPGLFTPVYLNGNWFADGALVNPVPVSVCRALGAERVIAIDLNAHLYGSMFKAKKLPAPVIEMQNTRVNGVKSWFNGALKNVFENNKGHTEPGVFDVLSRSVYIMQDRISRSRMAGDPPDVLLRPDLSDIGLLDFYRATESIDKGFDCVEWHLPALEALYH